MEQWEIELRERLNRELPNGAYAVGDNCFTGKAGYIEFDIAMRKKAKEMFGCEIDELKSQAIVNKKIDRP